MALALDTRSSPAYKTDESLALFYQMYQDTLPVLRIMVAENPTALQLLLFLIEKSTKANVCVANQAQLSKGLGKHRNTVSKAVQYLKENKLIRVDKLGTTNQYVLNARVVWQGASNQRHQAPFAEEIDSVGKQQHAKKMKELSGRLARKAQQQEQAKMHEKPLRQ
ncbi:helix-turn-helix domain-containing protein [Hymenobacter sp. BT507]|uniref:Helix-turn-helix domain-containing protein n=1 Tax=Hymenobacter citatus TaxID=2763506 RepID=A0ABR7MQ56_9BACT|nr:helix-turn-helix domain-containing protein [Hymenobacter citatus]MBC6613209.1 helix-turn-helix domain-containing protein [Hymenobacter citatus]